MEAVKKLLSVRKKKKAKKPDFRRQEGFRHVRLSDSWRRPRGRHSKLRKGKKAREKKPSPGYSSPKPVRGTVGGLIKVYVSNSQDLKGIDPNKEIAVVKSAVGKKKRLEIAQAASEMKIKVENAYKARLPGK